MNLNHKWGFYGRLYAFWCLLLKREKALRQWLCQGNTKPEYHNVNNDRFSYRSEGFFEFTVESFVHDGETYNFAWHKEKPSDDKAKSAAERHAAEATLLCHQ